MICHFHLLYFLNFRTHLFWHFWNWGASYIWLHLKIYIFFWKPITKWRTYLTIDGVNMLFLCKSHIQAFDKNIFETKVWIMWWNMIFQTGWIRLVRGEGLSFLRQYFCPLLVGLQKTTKILLGFLTLIPKRPKYNLMHSFTTSEETFTAYHCL